MSSVCVVLRDRHRGAQVEIVSIKLVRYASRGAGTNGKLSLASVEGEPERLGKAFLILYCIVLAQRK